MPLRLGPSESSSPKQLCRFLTSPINNCKTLEPDRSRAFHKPLVKNSY
jgi:hypothetical protein